MSEERRKSLTKVQLSDEDKEDIAKRQFEMFKEEFFLNTGRGVWKLVWKAVIVGIVMLAAYGAGATGWFKFGGN